MKYLCAIFILVAIVMVILNEPHGFACFTILAIFAGIGILTDDDNV